MGDFYGHNTAQFVPQYDWIASLGIDLADRIAKYPQQKMEYEKMQLFNDAIKEGQVTNGQVYSEVSAFVQDIPDDEFSDAFNMDKSTFLKIAKPGKVEGPEYNTRIVKALEGYNKIAARKRIQQAIGDIEARSQGKVTPDTEVDKMGVYKEGMTPETLQAIGAKGTADKGPVTPTEVEAIGQKYGVTKEQLGPQMQTAEAEQYARQMGKFVPGQTQAQTYKAIGEQPVKGMEGPIKAQQTANQIAINKRLEAAAAQKALNDAERNRIASWRASIQQNRLTSDERRDILKSQSKNEVDRLNIELKIKALETNLKTNSGKTDPNTFMPLISQEDTQSFLEELNELKFQLKDLQDINSDYEGLLKEKGGTVTTRPGAQPTPTKKSKFVIKSVR
jgi:hypothetical protein